MHSASQGTQLCTSTVKFASNLHHDKDTCNSKFVLSLCYTWDIHRLDVYPTSRQFDSTDAHGFAPWQLDVRVNSWAWCIMFKCSVQSLFTAFGQSGQFQSKHERFGSQCSDTWQNDSEVLLLLEHILMWIDSNLMKEYLSLSYLTGWGLFFMGWRFKCTWFFMCMSRLLHD